MIHPFMDFEKCEMPKGLVTTLKTQRLFTYEDVEEDLQEHIYSIDTLLEKMNEEPKFLSITQRVMVNRMARVLNKKKCGYFRFV